MSALCGVTGCSIEVTHMHGTGGVGPTFIPNMIGSWVREATSGGGAITHERQLYVYPRGPGDAPGNQWVCSCGGPWPCAEAVACSCHSDCACASCVEERSNAEPTKEQKTGWSAVAYRGHVAPELMVEIDALRAEAAEQSATTWAKACSDALRERDEAREEAARLQGVEKCSVDCDTRWLEMKAERDDMAVRAEAAESAAHKAEAELSRERAHVATCHACSAATLRDDEGRPCAFIKCPACDAKDCEALARERSARVAAEEDRDKWKSCYQTQEAYLEKIEVILTEAEAENKRLSQALAYERDEYGQYREAHPPWIAPWAAHALSSDEHNCRCGAPWPCAWLTEAQGKAAAFDSCNRARRAAEDENDRLRAALKGMLDQPEDAASYDSMIARAQAALAPGAEP